MKLRLRMSIDIEPHSYYPKNDIEEFKCKVRQECFLKVQKIGGIE